MHYDVFLCHNSLEKKAAVWLDRRLSGEGLRVFRDDRVIIPGTSLPNEIPEAVRASLSCVVLLGPSGIGDWQRTEIEIAVQKKTEDHDYRLIVVLLPGAKRNEIPGALRHLAWVDLSAGLEDEKIFRRLVDGVRGTLTLDPELTEASPLPTYRSMALPSEEFVQRPELDALLKALRRITVDGSPGSLTVAVTTALRGAGGFGKTTLAQAVCEQELVRRRFRAGILWTTLGERLTQAQRIARVTDLLRWWSRREPPAFETLEAAAAALRDNLSGQQVLVVVDDVWTASDLAPFGGLAPPAAVLVTTRNARALPPGVPAVIVDALGLPGAVELVSQGLTPQPPLHALQKLATRLGEWPILLRLVNAQLREEYREGTEPEAAFQAVEVALDEIGLTAFDREDEQARNLAVRRTVEASLRRLSPEDRACYARLAVFAENERVPLPVLELLWNAEEGEVYRRCRRLAQLSLLYRFDSAGRSVQLHDVMRAYLQREHQTELASFHGYLVDSYLRSGGSYAPPIEEYFLARLPYHLGDSGRERELELLLFSYSWLERKVIGAGVNAAMADYRVLRNQQVDASEVKEVLLLSRSVLTADSSQLAGQLCGRLVRSGSARIKALLDGAAARFGLWLRPLTTSLQQPTGPLVFSIPAHKDGVQAIVGVDEGHFATVATSGEGRLWNCESGELITTIPSVGTTVRHLASPAPNRLLAASDDGMIRLWDLDELTLLRSFSAHRSAITAFHSRQEEFLSGSEDGHILHWSIASDQPLASYEGHEGEVSGLGFLDSRTIVSAGKDRTLRVWNMPSGRQVRVLNLPGFPAEAMVITASNEVVLGTFAGEIQVWKPLSRDRGPRRSFRHRAVGLGAMIVWSRDLGITPIGGQSAIQLWNPTTGVLGPEVHVPGGGVTSLARFGADHLLCGCTDGTVSAWSVGALRAQMTAPQEAIYGVAAVDATTAVSASGHGSVQVWQVPSGSPLRSLEGHSQRVHHVCRLARERVAASSDHSIRVWNPHTGELLATLQSPEKLGLLTAFGEHLLVSAPVDPLAKDQLVRIWDVPRGREVAALPAIPGGVSALCSARGRFLFVGTYSGLVVHMDISTVTDRRNFVLRGHKKGVLSLAILNHGRLASGSLDMTIRVWDLATQVTRQLLEGHEGAVTGLAWVSSGHLVSASQDQTLKLWDLDTGKPAASLRLDTGVSSLAILTDQRTLVVGDAAGTVHFIKIEGV